MAQHFKNYAAEASRLANSTSTREETYYPAIKEVFAAILKEEKLPFEPRVNTKQERAGGGQDLPDVALYDGPGQSLVVCGEVKLPAAEIEQIASSTDQKDQVGRYLAQSRVVLLCNVRAFGLLTVDPKWMGAGPVPPAHRRLEQVAELWPSVSALKQGKPVSETGMRQLTEILEAAVTRYATIVEPESLARILARQARQAKADLPKQFSQAVRGLLDDFGKALGVSFEGEDGEEFFRSSLIQTAFYGLFAAWALWHHSGEKKAFKWEDLADYLKIPFLGGLFHEFRHPNRIQELKLAAHLDLATEALLRVARGPFFERFRLPQISAEKANPVHGAETAAILYFYEPFLEAFDPELRKQLGVWYTPLEIVQYQVRRIDQLLREELGCERGFADERVVVLDPCCGTGAYLIEVLRCVYDQLEGEGAGAMLGAKLLDACCRRILGFEILTAPFVIAQLQVYFILSKLGAAPGEGQTHRPAIFLTNALTGWDGMDQLKLNFPEMQQEHDAAQKVKREAKIIVILGNPPYNRFASVPMEEEADLADYYKGIRRDAKGKQIGKSLLWEKWKIRKQLLNELYVRFFRLAERRIGEKAEFGIVSFISNSSFLTGRSHPIMRESLVRAFNPIWIDNLNGDKYKTGKVIPRGQPGEGSSDQSIFTTEFDSRGIQVGAAITTMLKTKAQRSGRGKPKIFYRDFWGQSARKRAALLKSLRHGEVQKEVGSPRLPEGPRPYQEFEPEEKKRWKLVPIEFAGGYEDWPALDELFPTNGHGVNTNRGNEGSLIEFDRAVLAERMREYFSDVPSSSLAVKHPILFSRRSRYEPEQVRKKLLQSSKYVPEKTLPVQVFPLDCRWIYYETEAKLISEHGTMLAANLQENEFLVSVPQSRRASEPRPLIATSLFTLHLHDRGSVGFPASVKEEDAGQLFSAAQPQADAKRANLAEGIADTLAKSWGWTPGKGSAPANLLVRKLFRIVLAVAHSPQFESDHAEAVAQDWLHVPIPKKGDLAEELTALGGDVAALLNPLAEVGKILKRLLGSHLKILGVVEKQSGGAVAEKDLVISYSYFGAAPGGWRERQLAEGEILLPAFGPTTGDLNLNEDVALKNVPLKVWKYELGGYPVLKKWLGSRDAGRRPGMPLSIEEVDHLRSMIHRIAALLVLHEQLNTAYERAISDCFTAEELHIR